MTQKTRFPAYATQYKLTSPESFENSWADYATFYGDESNFENCDAEQLTDFWIYMRESEPITARRIEKIVNEM